MVDHIHKLKVGLCGTTNRHPASARAALREGLESASAARTNRAFSQSATYGDADDRTAQDPLTAAEFTLFTTKRSSTANTTNYMTRNTFGIDAYTDQVQRPRLMGADNLMSNYVYIRCDEDPGDIKESMIDMTSGRIAYAVRLVGGMRGMGEELFEVRCRALTSYTTNRRFTRKVPKVRPKEVPDFAKNN